MNNKDNELFNGIIDVPNDVNQNNDSLSSPSDLEYNFDFETQVQSQPTVTQTDSQVSSTQMSDADDSLFGGNQDIGINPVSNPNLEIMDFSGNKQPEQLNEHGKPIDHELLKNLAEDTNNLVNPDMLINPLGKAKEENKPVNVEEPKVDYDGIKTKKGYIFMAVIFLIIIVFIIFLPQIMALLSV